MTDFKRKTNSIDFRLRNNTLYISTRQDRTEKLSFKIVETKKVVINKITHKVLTSDQGDIFYIVNNKFHREGSRPAITCRRYTVALHNKDGINAHTSDEIKKEKKNLIKIWCKIWMKNGKYHRTNDKPALIWENGDLLWMLNGKFKRNPFTNASVHLPSDDFTHCFDSDNESKNDKWKFLSKEEVKEQEKAGLFNYKYA